MNWKPTRPADGRLLGRSVGALCLALLLSACTTTRPKLVIEPDTTAGATTTAGETGAMTDTATLSATVTGNTDGGAGGAVPGNGAVAANDVLISAQSLVGLNFVNQNGDVAGEIDDVMLDLDSGEIIYVIAKYGGILDIGATSLTMPLNAFRWSGDQLMLNFDESLLQDFPDVAADALNITPGSWDDRVVQFWHNAGLDPRFNDAAVSDTVVHADEVFGYDVADIGTGVGKVEDVLIDLGRGKIAYMLVAYTPALFNDELVAVPFTAFDQVLPVADGLTLDPTLDPAVLEQAPRFRRDELTGPGSATTFREATDYWSAQGFDLSQL